MFNSFTKNGKPLLFCLLILIAGCSSDDNNTSDGGDTLLTSAKWDTPGSVILSKNKWVEVHAGDMPLVISVPHGGFMNPDTIPKRNCKDAGNGRLVTVKDMNTIETAKAIEKAFQEEYHKTPYIIISNIARTKVDQNRDIELATCGNTLSKKAWNNFHTSIDKALASVVKEYGYSLYIDLHGHGHKNQRLELGYNLNGKDLRKAFNDEGGLKEYGEESSLRNYLKRYDKSKFRDLLWGENAFGTLIYKEGIPATPSLQDKYPKADETFFSGGYNTRRYTSSNYSKVFGWQIECNYKGVRDSRESRTAFANAFVNAYEQYVQARIE